MADDDETVGDLHLATVVVNVQDMERAVAFWSAALGYRTREERWPPDFLLIVARPGRRRAARARAGGRGDRGLRDARRREGAWAAGVAPACRTTAGRASAGAPGSL